MPTSNKPRKLPPSIKVYIEDKKFLDTLQKDAKRFNLSASQLALMSMKLGYGEVVKRLDEIS